MKVIVSLLTMMLCRAIAGREPIAVGVVAAFSQHATTPFRTNRRHLSSSSSSSMVGRAAFLKKKTRTTAAASPRTVTHVGVDGDDDAGDELAQYENDNNLDDQVFSAISGCGGVKVSVATVRNMVNDLMMQSTLQPVPADGLARAMTCGLLLSNGMPDEQTVQITMAGDGPLQGVVAIAAGDGSFKGKVGNPNLKGFTLIDAVGKGTVQIVKNHPDWKVPYNGVTAIRNGDVDRDVGIYLAESEQRSCALAAGTSINGILCTSAGGFLVEQLPFCDDESVARVERNLKALVEKDGGSNPPTNLLLAGTTPLGIAHLILDGLDMKPLQQIAPTLQCDCGEDRLVRALLLLPEKDVEEIISTQEDVEARCEFCSKVYRIGPDDIRSKILAAKATSS